MEQKNPNPHSKNDWIEPLRRNSWEMELLLTGFVLIGLIQLPEIVNAWWETFTLGMDTESLAVNIVGVGALGLLTGIKIITINLIILLLMRGFWIGMIGLSSAFPKGINTERLNYAERFQQKLRKNNLNTERLILQLDNLCSSIFALSFLFFFIAISTGLFLLQLFIIGKTHDFINYQIIEPVSEVLSTIFMVIVATILVLYTLMALLKLIDFVTIGALKKIKKKWFVKIYYPISQLISISTLGFLYRPIYYTLSSNTPRRVITSVLLIYISLTLVIFLDFEYRKAFTYYPSLYRNDFELSYSEYENLLPEEYGVIDRPIIQSDVISGRYLRLFIPYDIQENPFLKEHCPDLKPIQESFSSGIGININDKSIFGELEVTKEDVENALSCFASYYTLSISDSTYSDLTFLFHRHPRNEVPGILTHISVAHLEPGFYALEIREGDYEGVNLIQFWKE